MAMSDAGKFQPPTPAALPPGADDMKRPQEADVGSSAAAAAEDAGRSGGVWREKLKRHRVEAAARRVWVPDTWEQEGALLKDWDVHAGRSTALDRALFPPGLLVARESLMEECRRRGRKRAPGRSAAAPAPVRVLSNSC